MHPPCRCLQAADITCRLAGQQAEENEKGNGIIQDGKKTVFFIAKSYFIPNQVSNLGQRDVVQLQRTLAPDLRGAVSMKCNAIQNRQDTHAPEGSH